jgi:hypothetical protein
MIFTQIKLYAKTALVTNTSVAHPEPQIAWTEGSDQSYHYLVRSLIDGSWGLVISIPSSLAPTPRTVYWFHNNHSQSQQLSYLLSQASVNNNLYLVHETTGSVYLPATNVSFTGAAVSPRIYIHVFKFTNTSYRLEITNHFGQYWYPSSNAFDGQMGIASTTGLATRSLKHVPGQTFNNSELMNGRLWTPGLSSSTGLDTSISTSTSTLQRTVVATAASVNGHRTNRLTAATLNRINYRMYTATDTKELIFPLPTTARLTYPPDFDGIIYLPLFFGASVPSSGSYAYNGVKIVPADASQQALLATVAASATVNIRFDNTKHTGFTSAAITVPTLVVDITVLNYLGFFSDTTFDYFGIPVYLFMPGATAHRPSGIFRMINLPFTYTQLREPIVITPPAVESTLLWRGGNSLPASLTSGNYLFPVKNQFGWSALAKDFDMAATGLSYRLTSSPRSVYTANVLQDSTASMSFKIGVFEQASVDVRMQYRSPGYAFDFRPDDKAQFFYIELSTIGETITVTSHAHSSTTQPGIANSLVAQNESGQLLTWDGTVQLDLIVVKSTTDTTKATLTVYIGRTKAASFTVPWINSGSIMYFGTNRRSYTGATEMFTLVTPTETVNVTEPLSGAISPPPPTLHDAIEITTVLTSTTSVQTDPNVVYYHSKGATADLYIPHMTGTSPTEPKTFAVIRNFPHLSGATYEKIVNQTWTGAAYLRSFVINTTDTLQFPSTAGMNVGILYSHNPTNSGPFSVTLRTGINWATVIGTYTAEPTTVLSTYRSDPYLNYATDMISRFTTGVQTYPTRQAVTDTEVTLMGEDISGKGSAITLAYSVSSEDALAFSFYRTSVGLYVEGGYFDILIASLRKEHLFKVNPSGDDLDILPHPNLQMLRIRMTRDDNTLPVIQVSDTNAYDYTNQITLNAVGNFSTFDGTRKFTIGFERVGTSVIIVLYQDTDLVGTAIVPFAFPKSGRITFAHSNEGASTETIRSLTVSSGKVWLNEAVNIPLRMAPTISRSVSGQVVAHSDTVVYQIDPDLRSAYCDIYIYNSSLSSAAVTVSVGSDPLITIARSTSLPPNKTLVIQSRYLVTGEVISVFSTVEVRVRVSLIGELKTY